jgi:hypothetical protein
MSLRTYEAGVLEGKGPSVSVSITVQPELDVVEVPDVLLVALVVELLLVVLPDGVAESLLQASSSTEEPTALIIRLFKKFFRSIIGVELS